jgi:hypothetical protein
MKRLIVTIILLAAPLAVFAQAKPEVANAAKAAKRAWESAWHYRRHDVRELPEGRHRLLHRQCPL